MSRSCDPELVRFVCLKCSAKVLPGAWEEFWKEHDPSLAQEPGWLKRAKAWFEARGQQMSGAGLSCPTCQCDEGPPKWLVERGS